MRDEICTPGAPRRGSCRAVCIEKNARVSYRVSTRSAATRQSRDGDRQSAPWMRFDRPARRRRCVVVPLELVVISDRASAGCRREMRGRGPAGDGSRDPRGVRVDVVPVRRWRGRERVRVRGVRRERAAPPEIPDVRDDGVVEFSRVRAPRLRPRVRRKLRLRRRGRRRRRRALRRRPRRRPEPRTRVPRRRHTRRRPLRLLTQRLDQLHPIRGVRPQRPLRRDPPPPPRATRPRRRATRRPPRATRRVPRRAPLRRGDDQSAHLRARRRARSPSSAVVAAGGSAGLREPRTLALLLLTSILGLAPYAYVVFASGRGDGGTSPPGSWGATHEAAGWRHARDARRARDVSTLLRRRSWRTIARCWACTGTR